MQELFSCVCLILFFSLGDTDLTFDIFSCICAFGSLSVPFLVCLSSVFFTCFVNARSNWCHGAASAFSVSLDSSIYLLHEMSYGTSCCTVPKHVP